MLGLNPGMRAFRIEFLKTLVLKGFDHALSVACCATVSSLITLSAGADCAVGRPARVTCFLALLVMCGYEAHSVTSIPFQNATILAISFAASFGATYDHAPFSLEEPSTSILK